jgi:hypothetical protein
MTTIPFFLPQNPPTSSEFEKGILDELGNTPGDSRRKSGDSGKWKT